MVRHDDRWIKHRYPNDYSVFNFFCKNALYKFPILSYDSWCFRCLGPRGAFYEVNMVFSDIITLVKAIINEARLKIRLKPRACRLSLTLQKR